MARRAAKLCRMQGEGRFSESDERAQQALAWDMWRDPWRLLERHQDADALPVLERGPALVRRACAWHALFCIDEALLDVEAAFRAGLLHDRHAYARALGIRAIGAMLRNDPSAGELLDVQMRHIWRLGLLASDVAVGAMLNAASTATSPEVCTRYVDECDRLIPQVTYYSDNLRLARVLLSNYFRLTLGMDDASNATRELSALSERSQGLGESQVVALCHTTLATIFKSNHLYTPALTHAAIAAQLWRDRGRPERAAQCDMVRAHVLHCVGQTDAARAILDAADPPKRGSFAQVIVAERLSELSSVALVEGNFDEALALAQQCAVVQPPVIPGRPASRLFRWLEVLLTACLAADEQAAASALAEIEREVALISGNDPLTYFASVIAEVLANGAPVDELLQEFRSRFPDFPRSDQLVEVFAVLDQVRGVMHPGRDSSRTDIDEYWYHLEHLSGEDSENVREMYRSANSLPVLNRILGRQASIPAHLQFELVELLRFGTVAENLSRFAASDRTRDRLRDQGRDHLRQVGMLKPGGYGVPRPLAFGPSVTSSVCRTNKPPIDVDALIRSATAPPWDLLQVYRQGSTVHWVHKPGEGDARNGRLELSQRTRSVLRAFRSTCTPNFGEVEITLSAEMGLPTTLLGAVAAARTAIGPLVDSPELAQDLLLLLPRPHRRAVWARLVELELPSYVELCRAIGELVPASFSDEARPGSFWLSADMELASIPFAIAERASDGRPLLDTHSPVSLPPINLFATVESDSPSPSTGPVVRVGNTTGDLSFAGPRTPFEGVIAALLAPSEGDHPPAVLYRGHLYDLRDRAPSATGLYLDPTRVLRAGDLLEMPPTVRTPPRLALMACRAAGWDLGGEWGGIGSAALLRGTRQFLAPLWPLIDAPQASVLDDQVVAMLEAEDLAAELHHFRARQHDTWRLHRADTLPPHWWLSLDLTATAD